jgi:hypothetical protein
MLNKFRELSFGTWKRERKQRGGIHITQGVPRSNLVRQIELTHSPVQQKGLTFSAQIPGGRDIETLSRVSWTTWLNFIFINSTTTTNSNCWTK